MVRFNFDDHVKGCDFGEEPPRNRDGPRFAKVNTTFKIVVTLIQPRRNDPMQSR